MKLKLGKDFGLDFLYSFAANDEIKRLTNKIK
jgi:hypothetical protein